MKDGRWIFWVVGGIVVVGLVASLALWRGYRETSDEALAKAEEAIAAMEDAGLENASLIDPEQLAEQLGEDGGNVCVVAGSELQQGYVKTRLGVGGEFGFRATRLGDRVADGFLELVSVYCPENSDSAEAFIDSLQFDPVQN
jgi:hypothetical protein